MDGELSKALGAVAGMMVSLPVVTALVRATLWVGELKETVRTLAAAVAALREHVDEQRERIAAMERRSLDGARDPRTEIDRRS